MIEDKVTLARKRAELVEILLATQLPTVERVRIQGDLSLINAKIKALNTTAAAQLKAVADRKKVAGLAEARANTARARANIGGGFQHHYRDDLACPACGTDGNAGCIVNSAADNDDDAGQTATIDAWIDAVLLRHGVSFTRKFDNKLTISASLKEAAVLSALVEGIYAAARGQELPDLPRTPKATPKATKKR